MRAIGIPGVCTCAVVLASFLIADTESPRKIRIELERLQNGAWNAVDPGLVLAQGDRVRFRIETNFSGYVYVINYGTSGSYSVLFPSKQAGSSNKITAGESRQIPSGDLIFRISGPAGQDIVYWIVSPVELPGYGATPPAGPPSNRPAILIPRCDDTLLRARGECIDSTAGTRDLDQTNPGPAPLKSGEKPADLTFLREDKNSIVASSASAQGPMIYEFRIAHK